MIVFLGEYEATLDAKGRFLLPGGLLKQLPEGAATSFVVNRGFDECLNLYPKENWQPVTAEVNSLSEYEPENRKLKRLFNNGATEVSLDTANRLLLPANLKGFGSLQRDIVLASSGNKIEIWDKTKYQQFFDSFTPETFSSLAQKVMGKKTGD
ncbi:MAG: division/cell wall cluster transcriptional repressor MraZ [Gemmatimonadaceae bacterium]|nr:division/cell wall cluster transcriptional repressor MraZ [Chitinophagaceae bacterium]